MISEEDLRKPEEEVKTRIPATEIPKDPPEPVPDLIPPSPEVTPPAAVAPFKTKFNWGAFAQTLLFSIGNKTYLGLLVLIPLVNLVWIFVMGFKGEEWALEHNEYRDEEEFRKVMDTWNRAGFVMFIIAMAIFVIYLVILFLVIGVASFQNW